MTLLSFFIPRQKADPCFCYKVGNWSWACGEVDILASHALKTNEVSSIAATPVCPCCFRLLWGRVSVCPSFLMGSLGGECHQSAGWMRCPKDPQQACLLSSASLNCELGLSWSTAWGYEFNLGTKKGNKYHIQQCVSVWKHTCSVVVSICI